MFGKIFKGKFLVKKEENVEAGEKTEKGKKRLENKRTGAQISDLRPPLGELF